MLMVETGDRYCQKGTDVPVENVMEIGRDTVMQSAMSVLVMLNRNSHVVLKASGNYIPDAVAVANIVTTKLLNGRSRVQNIILDTEHAPGIGRMTSTVEIIIEKT